MTLLKINPQIVNTKPSMSLASLIGGTPLIPLRGITSHLNTQVKVFAKAEWFNPGGSVKDRPALNIIRHALASGELGGGRRLLDSTSGNMGISYATLGAAMRIPVTLAVPANASPERMTVLRALGAEIILTDPSEGSDGAILEARRLAAQDPDQYWYADQYNNPANWQSHYEGTGPELFNQTSGQITHFVAGLGTSGTLIGTGRFLREQNPHIQIISMQPDAAFHGLEGLKHMPTSIKPGIFDESFADLNVEIRTEAAHDMVLRLSREEGLFVGISSGAAAVAALDVAGKLESGSVVTVFPDAGYKYLSEKALWEDR